MSWCSSDCALSQQISATKWLTTNILQLVCFRQDRKCQPWQGSRLLPGSRWSHTSVCDWTVRENVFLLVGHGEKERMLKTLPARDFWVALLSRRQRASLGMAQTTPQQLQLWSLFSLFYFAQSTKHKQKKRAHSSQPTGPSAPSQAGLTAKKEPSPRRPSYCQDSKAFL